MKFRLFISSVQSEFADERVRLKAYIEKSPLLRRFFSVFVFESDVPPQDRRTDEVYLDALGQSDIYLALVGDRYAGDAAVTVSPTEREYDEATRLGMRRIVLVKGDATGREDRERALLEKMSASVTWHAFADSGSLLNWVLAALDKVMEDECLFRTLPFDRSECAGATLADLNENRIRWFVKKARKERNFALPEDASTLEVLTHLKLADAAGGLTNAALLLFGKDPQRWHLTSEVKCVHWHGVQRVKPIRSYKVYKGTLFDMADQAVEFVMAKLDYSVGVRNHGPEVDRDYEIPEEVVSEAIINAIAHRDYLSTGSVQIELFSDRLEIYNPGSINPALTPEKLTERHGSFPNNPLIAEPLYLTRYIERLGTGLTDLIEHCHTAGLPDPEFHIDHFEFGIVIRRKGGGGVSDPVKDPVNGGVKDVDAVNDAVNDVVNSLYEYIKGHPGLNGRKLAVALSCSEPTIDRQVKVLKVKGLVEFRGAPKNGGYYDISDGK